MGGVVACDEQFAARLRQVRFATGGVLHPMAGYLLLRGLSTLPVRVRAASTSAAELSRRLAADPRIARVHYPKVGGAMVSFEVYGDPHRVISAVRLITPAVSLGSVDTLIQHPASISHRIVAEETGRPRVSGTGCCACRSAWRTSRTCGPICVRRSATRLLVRRQGPYRSGFQPGGDDERAFLDLVVEGQREGPHRGDHTGVGRLGDRVDALAAGLDGERHQTAQQLGADAAALPVVLDEEGDLGLVAVPEEVAEGDEPAGGRLNGQGAAEPGLSRWSR